MDSQLLTPIYSQSQASSIIGMPRSTFNTWARGYETSVGNRMPAFITIARPGRGYTVPYVGLSEAWIVRAFTRAGVPVSRIRPALERLRTEIGLEHALASDQIRTDGAEILWDLRKHNDDFADDRLVVVRNGQAMFGEIVRAHLKQIDYRDGFVGQLRIPRADGASVTVDPRINFGQPTLTDYGVRLDDILGRVTAGEPMQDVAADFDLPLETVTNLALKAA